jgi:hypothetical protein
MADTRIKIGSIVQNQLPDFVLEEYPLVSEFLKEYYNSVEGQGSTLDILQNIDQYLKVDELYKSTFARTITVKPQSPQTFFQISGGYSVNDLIVLKNGTKLLKDTDYFATDGSSVILVTPAVPGDVLEFVVESPSSTILTSDVEFVDTTINVASTYGFPDTNGIIQIDSEIILYSSKTSTSFKDCTRGFSGITSYRASNQPDQLVFSTSEIAEHTSKTTVANLSSLFLKEFLTKIKSQLVPGFENRTLAEGLDERNFIKNAKSFYSSKGTDDSYKLLFKALFGQEVSVIKPRDYLLKPSDAQYRVVRDLVVESISGDPMDLENRTLYQDQVGGYNKAYGSVTKVEKIQRSGRTFYVLSLDYDYNKDLTVSGSIYGNFSIHPSTKVIAGVSTSSTVIDADSTIGFPSNGQLDFNVNGIDYTISYFNKNTTQFYITSSPSISIPTGTDLKLNQYAYANVGVSTVKVRITGVLSEVDYDSRNTLMKKGDSLSAVSLGYNPKGILANNWIFNLATKYNVKTISGPNSSNLITNVFTYEVSTYDPHSFSLGDNLRLINPNGDKDNYKVVSVNNEYSIVVEGVKINNLTLKYVIERILKKPKFTNYTDVNSYSANIQNVYLNNEDEIYVTSNSLPNYLDEDVNTKNTNVIFSGIFNGETLDLSSGNPTNLHGFITGDAIVYSRNAFNPDEYLNISEKTYFVKRVDNTTIKIASSKTDLYKNKFVTVSGTAKNNIFKRLKFNISPLSQQGYIKKISKPVSADVVSETPTGPVGIFVNGVEAYSYKSTDKVFYGGIQSINVIGGGENYDVINTPTVLVEDSVGYGASAFAHVVGKLEKIDVIDGGFDYLEDPIITITGGNGYGAYAKPNMTSFRHSVSFNSIQSSGFVNLTTNTIGFSSYHKFRDYERVTYLTEGQTGVGGLSTNAQYHVSVQDAYNVRLHKTLDDAVSGINTVDLTSYGVGIHLIESTLSKRKISNVSVLNLGSGYTNKKISCAISGIHTSSNTIKIIDHGYKTGEIVVYNSTGSAVGGLSNNQSYYITAVNKDEFKLSQVGIATTNKDFYFKTKQFINLTSVGSSYHTFNYPNIVVSVSGKIGVSTLTGQDFSAKLQPSFKGEISNIFIKDSGVGYGSSEIINYERQPKITLGIGSGAQLSPVLNGGRITEVIVLNSGNNYTSAPKIEVLGIGTGAVLTPIVNSGKIVEVKVVNGGVGFNTTGTFLNIVPSGNGFSHEVKIKSWTINTVERYLNDEQIVDDDGVVEVSSYTVSGSQYCHLYAPRKLRRSVFGIDYVNGNKVYVPDLKLVNNREVVSTTHSPIIGWAYDGNPIYGPYGYSEKTGGSVRELTSGYISLPSSDRPDPISTTGQRIYPEGFFVEDYQYNASGDLDEHNGRFCVTPEYPNGTYAYFTTINNGLTETAGVFRNYKKPVFPYIVGNTFKSTPIDVNYDRNINQNNFNYTESGIWRNTKPYNLKSNNSGYDFVFDPLKVRKPVVTVRSTSVGQLSNVGVVTGGSGYKVGDTINFNNTNSGGFNAYGQVSFVKGKEIKSISFASTYTQGVEFYPYNNGNKLVGFSSLPHSFISNDIVSISGLSTSVKIFNSFFVVGVNTHTLVLSKAVGNSTSTGIVTYFDINGSLDFSYIRENDVYKVENEKVKVLSVDELSSRIKVLRGYDSTVGVSHTASTVLYEQTRKFTIGFRNNNSNFNFNFNRELYFNPTESLSLGTTSGVGIGSTLYFSNPGAGITNIFVPTKTIYLQSHSLNTGDELIYSSNGGSPFFVSDDGASSFQLLDNQVIYVAKVSDDLIGISTNKVGLGSTGSFVGINSSILTSTVYFTNVGSGVNHSFKTNYSNVLTGEVLRNTVTVAAASTHGLERGDSIFIDSLPGITTNVVIKYNDENKRLLVNPRSFTASAVNLSDNKIYIENHEYTTGQKVVYNATTSIGGLENDKIYYIVRYNKDYIRLSSSYYNATKEVPEIIDFTSTSEGSISLVNPSIPIIPNQTINFDLSDRSLSFTKNANLYSAFDFVIYSNSNFTKVFDKIEGSSNFSVIKTGKIGIDSTSSVKLTTSGVETDLYYRLVPVDLFNNSTVKKEIIIDDENVDSNNTLKLTRSSYSGFHNVVGVGQTTFTFNIIDYPEKTSYTSSDGLFEYFTDSKTAIGAISEIDLLSGGKNYQSLPGITSVFSEIGRDAILNPNTSSIGNINRIDIDDIGFDYPSDITLSPSSKLPQVLKVKPLSTFDNIGVSSVGINYTLSPNLVVIDSVTNKVVTDVDLKFNIKTKEVDIIKNTDGINNATPRIVPINNSNGVSIDNVTFNNSTKDVTIELGVNYSFGQTFPFNVGDRVLVENVSVGIATTAKGYNSKNYDYALFTLTSVSPQYGGSGASITYNLSNYLSGSEIPGTFNAENSAGIVVPEKYFPVFNPVLKPGAFIVGEKVTSESYSGTVLEWNSDTEQIKVSSSDSFDQGKFIRGETSNAKGTIGDVQDFNAVYLIGPSAVVNKGWNKETGFLNNALQVTSDNNYYQYFSYSIKSKVDYETWNESIGNLNHTVGFKKFGDLEIESIDASFTGISTAQNEGSFIGISDLIQEIDLNCVNDFDLAREKTIKISDNYISNEIILNTVSLQDEFQSLGNRVLMIDDFSDQFSNVPAENNYANADTFRLSDIRSKKYVTYVRDKRFTGLRQVYLVSLLHDGLEGYLSQYARVETNRDLGSFDFSIFGSEGTLRFYPLNFLVNDYDISVMSYGITDIISGIGSTSLGNIVELKSSTATIPSGTSSQTTIVGIGSTYRASKVLVELSSTNGEYYEFNELTLIHDGNNVSILEYGQLSNESRVRYVGDGIGSYTAYISGSNINLDFTPNVGLGTTYIANTVRVSVASTIGTNTGSLTFNTGQVQSSYVSISSSPTPTQNKISTYSLDHSGAYYFVVVEDKTNNTYQASEITVVDDDTDAYLAEFGIVESSSGLGTMGVGVGATGTSLYFTPNPNINVDVRVYQHAMRVVDVDNSFEFYSLENARIDSKFTGYQGTYNSIKKSFNLYHQQNPIFQRVFNASDSTIVDITKDTIRIPKHYFVTGEELAYSEGDGSPIGIATTTITGIGTTDKLPSSVFVVKVNDLNIKLASSAQNALKTVPEVFSLTSVGIGTTHKLTSLKQNAKSLISIDNLIQTPIVSTSTTTFLSRSSSLNENTITLSGITSIFGGDLLKVDNEIIKVNTVGFGSTNVLLVDRGWMGTDPANHLNGSLITKITGNYNIIDNTIHFVEAPYGNSPIGTITNKPDSRDYTGITTRSTFSGRVFLRSGLENGTLDSYDKNYIFDGLSEQFTGIQTQFKLTSNKSDVSGISTGSIILLINNIFQEPQRLGTISIQGDYKMSDGAGITTLAFTGSISSTSYDVNTASIPRGGVIVSVASSQGFGYQPLVSAGGTSIVSVGGTISSISVGNIGSGYRGQSKYEIITQTSTSISAGSTIIPINNSNGVIQKLSLSSSNTINIGSTFIDVPIVGVGISHVLIGSGNTSSQGITADSTVLISLNSPTIGFVDVGVKTASIGNVNYEFIGFATISSGHVSNNVTITNPGSGYTSSNPPVVVFDSPLSYSNIPLIYAPGYSGIGTAATVNIVVGQASSITDFEIKNLGYAYKVSEVLTVPTGGLTGIPTDPSKPFRNFELSIDQVFSDAFSAWSVGDLQVIDKIENLFNGTRRTFPIKINGTQTSIRARVGSNIDVQATLLVFINDVLQVPGSGYIFKGGSIITFTEAPKEGDSCKIIFYKGTESVDVLFADILETIKIGDDVRLNSDNVLLKEDDRLVTEIVASDTIQTNSYPGPGLTLDEDLSRPLIWCRQTEDKIINGKEIGKDRELYEPLIQPLSNIISNVGIGSTEIFVQSVKIFFDDSRENATIPFKTKILVTSQDTIVGASATAIVSAAGTVSSISLSNSGSGFTTTPSVTISNPIGFGTSVGIGSTALAISSITSGIVTSFTITNPGFGYTSSKPPQVLIEYPALNYEKIEDVTYEGDFGIIVGIKTTTVGVASTGIVFDLFVPTDSYLRNTNINVGIATTGISGIKTDYYFTVFNSNIGFGITSLDSNSSIVGVGTTCLDNVYKVASVSIASTSVPGVGVTNVSRVVVSVLNYNGLTGTGFSNFYGEFSWGRISVPTRKNPTIFTAYTRNGISGLSTSPIVQRLNPLRYVGYSTTLQQ